MFVLSIRGFAPLSLALATLALAGCETTSRSVSVPQVTVIEDDKQGTSAVNIASLTEVIQRNPSDPSAYNTRGAAHARVGRYVDAIEGTGAILLDTRKTIPGLRALEKYAARMGGAQNHRMRLDDGLLIKDNHVGVCGGVAEAVRAAKASGSGLQIQVEVDRIAQIEPALAAGAERLLLDNMEPETLAEAVALVAGRVPLEASGGVNLDTIRGIAESGVDYISVGRITQSAPAVDIGLDYVLKG